MDRSRVAVGIRPGLGGLLAYSRVSAAPSSAAAPSATPIRPSPALCGPARLAAARSRDALSADPHPGADSIPDRAERPPPNCSYTGRQGALSGFATPRPTTD